MTTNPPNDPQTWIDCEEMNPRLSLPTKLKPFVHYAIAQYKEHGIDSINGLEIDYDNELEDEITSAVEDAATLLFLFNDYKEKEKQALADRIHAIYVESNTKIIKPSHQWDISEALLILEKELRGQK